MNKKHILNINYGVIIKKSKYPLQEGLFSRINLLKGFDFGPVLYHNSISFLFKDEVYSQHDISLEPYHRIKNFEYINHSGSPSCTLLKKGKIIHLIAHKSLFKNEEITLHIPHSCDAIGIPLPQKYTSS